MTSDAVGPLGIYRDRVEAQYGEGDRYEAALKLMIAERRLTNTITNVIKQYGLNRAQWSVLTILHLSSDDSIPLGRIAHALSVHGTNITNAVDKLIDQGLAERVLDPKDRRSVRATITPAGAAASDEILRALAQEKFGLASLTNERLGQLARVLDDVTL